MKFLFFHKSIQCESTLWFWWVRRVSGHCEPLFLCFCTTHRKIFQLLIYSRYSKMGILLCNKLQHQKAAEQKSLLLLRWLIWGWSCIMIMSLANGTVPVYHGLLRCLPSSYCQHGLQPGPARAAASIQMIVVEWASLGNMSVRYLYHNQQWLTITSLLKIVVKCILIFKVSK